MAFSFKVWDQARDGATMAIRVANTKELRRLARVCTGADLGGSWTSLTEYLDEAATATIEPAPFVRMVDVLWQNTGILLPYNYSQNRRFRVTYSGRPRATGGFASQAYCVMDPAWEASLRPHENAPLPVDYHPGADRDLIVVLA